MHSGSKHVRLFFVTLQSARELVSGALQGGAQADTKTKSKFSSFFNNVVIELDKELYGPDNHLAEWHRSSSSSSSSSSAELDGFTVS